MGQPAHAAVPPRSINPKDLRPRRRLYLVALVIFLVLGAAGGVIGGVLISRAVGNVSIQTVSTGPQQVRFSGDRSKQLYVSGGVPITTVPHCDGNGPGQLRLSPVTGKQTLTVEGKTWTAVADIVVTQPGTYSVRCQSIAGTELAVGNTVGSFLGPLFGGFGAIFGGGGLGLLIGGIMAIVVLVKRSGHKNRLLRGTAPATAGGYGVPGTPPHPGRGQGPQPWQPAQQQPGQPQPGGPVPGQQPPAAPPQPGQGPQPGQAPPPFQPQQPGQQSGQQWGQSPAPGQPQQPGQNPPSQQPPSSPQ